MRTVRALAALAVSAVFAAPAFAADGYRLEPEEIAPGVHLFRGVQDEVSPLNGGNIANTGFIVGDGGVLAVDTGPSRRYAERMLAAIEAATGGLPVRYAVVTHHHFDHSFGIPAFRDAGISVVMHRDAAAWLARDGAQVRENITALAGEAWMAGTDLRMPDMLIDSDMEIDLGGRIVDLEVFRGGHTAGDIVVLDRATGTLFAGDLVFHERVPSLPHGDAETWRSQLAEISGWEWRRLVPGHGPPVTDRAPLDLLAGYLGFVQSHVACAWRRGDSRAEALLVELPEAYAGFALVEREFQRTVFQLWRRFDAAAEPPPCP